MKGELFINEKDAWLQWGIMLNQNSLSALLTPSSMKDYPTNNVRLEHGKRYLTKDNAKEAERDLTIQFDLVASSRSDFFSKYESFCEELHKGKIVIRTQYQTGVYYKCLYRSCSQYSMYNGKVGKFSLKLTEPNPNDREEDKPETT